MNELNKWIRIILLLSIYLKHINLILILVVDIDFILFKKLLKIYQNY